MKTIKKNLFQITKVFFVFALIIFLNFSNIGSGLFLQNAQATESDTTTSTQNPDLTVSQNLNPDLIPDHTPDPILDQTTSISPTSSSDTLSSQLSQGLSQDSNSDTQEKTDLNSTDSFDPNAIPYFLTGVVPPTNSTTITVCSRWTNGMTVSLLSADPDSTDSVISAISVGASDCANIDYDATVSSYLKISASSNNGFRSWHFYNFNPFIRSSGTYSNEAASLVYVPDMRYFTEDVQGTRAGNYFFAYFNHSGSLTSLPDYSFDVSSITSAGYAFFTGFNQSGSLTSLPEGSFDTSNFTSAGDYFFSWFNQSGSLTSLPENSFNTSNITTAGQHFFATFNDSGSLTSLPEGSFNTSNITTVDYNFFGNFNYDGSLRSLPAGSFNFDALISITDLYFLDMFNEYGSLTSLPYNSFKFPNLETAPDALGNFNSAGGALTKVDNGVSIRNINNGDREFFWAAGSKYPAGSETLAHGETFCCYKSDPFFITETVPPSANATTITITNKWTDKIYLFIQSADDDSTLSMISIPGSSAATITYIPTVSSFLAITGTNLRNWRYVESPLIQASGESASNFETFVNISDISDFTTDSSGTEAGDNFFSYFFKDTKATSLPADSFDTSSITTAGNNFFNSFNLGGSLTSLPVFSFTFDNLVTTGSSAFQSFNQSGSLRALPEGSFDFSKVSSTSDYSFSNFNYNGKLTKENSGISIKNISNTTQTFYWTTGTTYSAGSLTVDSGSSFTYYKSEPATITMSFNSNGGSRVYPIYTTRGQKYAFPYKPTKSGSQFIQWLTKEGNPYDWNAPSYTNLTLTAQWRALNFSQVPYFQTQACTPSDVSTITITNHWADTTLTVEAITNDTTLTILTIEPSTQIDFDISSDLTLSVDTTLSIWTEDPNGFRNWTNAATAFLIASGECVSEYSSFDYIPDIRYFTTESSGTEAGEDFFFHFFDSSPITSLPAGSFDISTITKVNSQFFQAFNNNGSLTALPEGSFNTSNIRETGSDFLNAFNQDGSLTSLPRFSFNFNSLQSHEDHAFTAFNQSGSLTSLPYNSFYLNDTTVSGVNSWNDFNQGGLLTRVDSGITIRNTSSSSQTFYWDNAVDGSTSSIVESDQTFTYYNSDPAGAFTLSFDTDLGTAFEPVIATQGEKFIEPSTTPTKIGYRFLYWSLDQTVSTPYDWNATATQNLILYAFYDTVANVPHFETQTATTNGSTSFTIWNHWSAPIFVEFENDGVVYSTTLIDPTASIELNDISTSSGDSVKIWARDTDGFREWNNYGDSFVVTSGNSASELGSFDYIPAMKFFTTDSSGTEAGDYFFQNFFANTNATSLPEGSFDTYYITTANDNFFAGFNQGGSLTSLPVGSFNFDNLSSHGDYAFANFNQFGSLTSLPFDSFYLASSSTNGDYSWKDFNDEGLLTKESNGVAIRNTSDQSQSFFWKLGSSSNWDGEEIVSDGTFTYYKADPPRTFTMSFDTNGGSELDSIVAIQPNKFIRPTDPTKSDFELVQWVKADGTPYDWNSKARQNLTLTAQWIDIFDKIPYFQYQTIDPSVSSYTFQIRNAWTNTIRADIKSAIDGSTLTYMDINPSAINSITYTPNVSIDLTISAKSKDGFRSWNGLGQSFITITTGTTLQKGSLVHVPNMRFFTTNSTGTEAGNNFFSNFVANNGSITGFPEGSFNISTITKENGSFFSYFNYRGNLVSLPEGSFDTSNITTAGHYFFYHFNDLGTLLTSLPAGSFKLDHMKSVGWYFFDGFNGNGSLTALPFGSFDTSNITQGATGGNFFAYFNAGGRLTLESPGVSIQNKENGRIWLYHNYGTTTLEPGETFCCYKQDKEFTQIPYFRSETVPVSQATTITITNKWNQSIVAKVRQLSNNATLRSYNIAPAGSTTFTFTPSTPVDLTISATDLDGFRDWANNSPALVTASGPSASQFSSYAYIPNIRYFTIDESGKEAGDNFFNNFFTNSPATTLPQGSFDISTITKVSDSFFENFNGIGSLTALPDGSFNTTKIREAGKNFFFSFNFWGDLTSLPRYSFNLNALQSHGDYAFYNFNAYGSLKTLPYDSINTKNVTICSGINCDLGSFDNFNYYGKLSKATNGVAIRNTSAAPKTFYWANSSGVNSGSQGVYKGGTFAYYQADASLTFTMTFNTNGGSHINPISVIQSQTFPKPTDPTKSGYVFVQWLIDEAKQTPYNWSATATGNVTLYAQWEEVRLDVTPYFRTVASDRADDGNSTTITIHNKWNQNITATLFNDDTLTIIDNVITIAPSSSQTLVCPPQVSADLTISANDENGFRTWTSSNVGFIEAEGPVAEYFNTFAHIPNIRFFTVDPEGTEAGDYFFNNFFKNTKATTLPNASFDISTITKVGNDFFNSFNNGGSLTALPAGSFYTSHIKEAGTSFFDSFNNNGSLTTLPALSFNFSALTSHKNGAFFNFNNTGSLAILPYNSFNMEKVNICSTGGCDSLSWQGFNENGLLNQADAGVSIINTSSLPQYFYWADDYSVNSGSQQIRSGFTFSYYATETALTFTMFFVPDNGSQIDPITTQQDVPFINPPLPSRPGYIFAGWFYEDGTPYVWGSAVTSNVTLYAHWTANSAPVITNITPKQVQNGKVSTVTITGTGLDDTSYSFGITSTRFGDSSLPTASKIYNKIFSSSSITGRTATSATLKIPSVNWAGTYTIQLLNGSGLLPSKTILIYQLPLGTAKSFTDISKISSTRQASVKWLAQTGVTGGCDSAGTKYCPDDLVNRGAMAAFLQLLAGYPSGSSKTSSFADVFSGSSKTVTYVSGSKTTKTKVSALSEKRIGAINWLALTGITGGSGSAKVNGKVVTTYRPQDSVNRGAMASFMLKFSEDIVPTITSDNQTGFADIKIGSGNFTITYKGAKKGEKVAKLSAARATAIKWMLTAGITGGSGTDKNGKTTYRPQDNVNRGSMATFMKNLAVYMKFTS